MRVLVSPASKHGGTTQIGRAMAQVLRSNGVDVDVMQPEDIHDLSPYAAYLIGSALYMGSWLPDAQRFIDEHGDELRRRPTWLFSSGPLGPHKPKEPIDSERADHLMSVTGARDHRIFGGRIELDRLSRSERFIARWVGVGDGDHRDWDEIEAWTDEIVEVMKAEVTDDADFRTALERLLIVLDTDGVPDSAELRNVADEHLAGDSQPEPDRHPVQRLKSILEHFETDHPDLTRAVSDVSYHLSGMGI